MSDRDRLADWLLTPRGASSGSSDEERSGEGWSAPPLARAERPPGQEPRTKDLRADEPADDAQG